MPFERTPLPEESLGHSIAPFFAEGAPAGKVMLLARGLAPGLGHVDLATGLYQATHHENPKIAETARKSLETLPEPIVLGALNAALHPMVLDLFAELHKSRAALLERILLNANAADETFERLAKTLKADRLLEIVAKNEQRLLRHPAIIKAVYLNAATRMSTANRCVELAVRNNIVLDIPAYGEIAASLGAAQQAYADPMDQALADAAADSAFHTVVAEGKTLSEEEIPDDEAIEAIEAMSDNEELRKHTNLLGLTIAQKIRLSMIGTGYHRALLLRDPNRVVAMAAIKSPMLKETEVVLVSQSRSINDDVIRYIARNRDFLKLHQIKVNLANNPKCPLPTAMRLLPYLRLNELRKLSRSKNVPNSLRTAAKNLLGKRG